MHALCLHNLMQKREAVWKNLEVFICKPSLYKLSNFPQHPLVFVSGYANTIMRGNCVEQDISRVRKENE